MMDSQLLTNTTNGSCLLNNPTRISVYTVTTFSATIFSFGRAIVFCFICINASRVLHNRMFDTILHAKMLFFDSNPIGESSMSAVITLFYSLYFIFRQNIKSLF